MSSHSYLQNLCSGSACNQMNTGYLMELGDTTVDNFQAVGGSQQNFMNQYGHGDTQVNNLVGLGGSVQNFGLQELGNTLVDNF